MFSNLLHENSQKSIPIRSSCFLANIHPTLQSAVRLEMEDVRLTGRRHDEFLDYALQRIGRNVEAGERSLINDTETEDAGRGEESSARGQSHFHWTERAGGTW